MQMRMIIGLVIGVVVGIGILAITYSSNQGSIEPRQTKQELDVKLSNIDLKSIDDRSAMVEITLSIANPTSSTVILESISYTLYVNDVRVVESMIGKSLEGIVTSSGSTQYILPNTHLTLKDTVTINKGRALDGIWILIKEGSARWSLDGRYSVTGWGEKEFRASLQ
jgi:LEA14-like dessication related protein